MELIDLLIKVYKFESCWEIVEKKFIVNLFNNCMVYNRECLLC